MRAETGRNGAGRTVDLEQLLIATSRTFALSIPLLPEPTRREVTLAYLLFRIADTFEDAPSWPRAARIEALERFGRLLEQPRTRQEIDERLPPTGPPRSPASSPATASCWPSCRRCSTPSSPSPRKPSA